MPQPAASNALRRANEFANVPIAIVLHTGAAAADLTRIGGIPAEGVRLSVKWFRRTSRAVHCAPASLANRTMQALQSVAIKREPPRCHAVEQCGMAWQPASLPAVRSTAAFLANARALRTPGPCERQVLSNAKSFRTPRPCEHYGARS